MGADVTVLSRSLSKREHATTLGADMLVYSDEEAMLAASKKFDVILDTVSVPHDVVKLLPTLKTGGTLVCIGLFTSPLNVSPFDVVPRNLKIEGSLVGGIPETQQMLNFCDEHNIKPEIKIIHAKDASAQFVAMAEGDADIYRAVIDMSTLTESF